MQPIYSKPLGRGNVYLVSIKPEDMDVLKVQARGCGVATITKTLLGEITPLSEEQLKKHYAVR